MGLNGRNLPASGRATLARTRARIAHGSTDGETLSLAFQNLGTLQRLVLDGLALVCGLDPDSLQMMEPRPFEWIAPMLEGDYSAEHDPAKTWGGLLSDAHVEWLKKLVTTSEQ